MNFEEVAEVLAKSMSSSISLLLPHHTLVPPYLRT